MILHPLRLRPILAAVLVAAIALLAAIGLAIPASPSHASPAPTPSPVYSPVPITDGGESPQPPAGSWLVGDLDSGEVWAGKDVDGQYAPASTIKLLTVLALEPRLSDKDAEYKSTDAQTTIDGTKAGMLPGNSYTVDQLFHAVIMASANDAAHALGELVGGQDKAVDLMNQTAARLGMTRTLAVNTSGLDAPGQVMSAGDLMILAHAYVENDYLMDVAATETFDWPGGTDGNGKKWPGFPIQNHTRIVGEVDGGLGLKNGYTTAALGSYVAVAERGDRRVVATILNCGASTRNAAKDLLEWGFAQSSPEAVASVALEPTPPPSRSAPAIAPGAVAATEPAATGSATSWGLAAEPRTVIALAIGVAVLLAVALVIVLRSRRRFRR